jgi:hypothetical protein
MIFIERGQGGPVHRASAIAMDIAPEVGKDPVVSIDLDREQGRVLIRVFGRNIIELVPIMGTNGPDPFVVEPLVFVEGAENRHEIETLRDLKLKIPNEPDRLAKVGKQLYSQLNEDPDA